MNEFEMLCSSWKESGITAAKLDSGEWGCMMQTKRMIGDGKPAYTWTTPIYHLFNADGKRLACATDYRTVAAGIELLKKRYCGER